MISVTSLVKRGLTVFLSFWIYQIVDQSIAEETGNLALQGTTEI